ncbi:MULTISPECIES: type 2 isopentenyl-diphosphate Delta-isomerase [Bacillus]|uniref:type 2 isopentenyl-diphosphate Delta-isomerase n=1 Tax=Bacillus TaxID=1386 RepID=UPI0002FE0001|nr:MULTISPECIES: type 2 isopentenyl-diphosphate Delta-isomerase [Bacillus]
MSRISRKLEHIEYALKTGQNRTTGLDDITFVHRSLPQIALDDVNLELKIGELSLSSPIFINAMTGGGGIETEMINRDIAIAARESGIAMSVGSQMSALRDENQKSTYQVVRKENPQGFIMGNIGGEATVDEAKRAIDMIEANALQIHLNVIQELVMPEGDRDFRNVLHKIEEICSQVSVPVIVKEVGFGMSKETVTTLASVGVTCVDISGSGGTNFAAIENERRSRLLDFFNSWGITTSASIIEATHVPNMHVLASGGIQNGLDVAKCLSLGAKGVGVAGHLLKKYKEFGLQTLIDEINIIQQELSMVMTALGVKRIDELSTVEKVITGDTLQWIKQRNLK